MLIILQKKKKSSLGNILLAAVGVGLLCHKNVKNNNIISSEMHTNVIFLSPSTYFKIDHVRPLFLTFSGLQSLNSFIHSFSK